MATTTGVDERDPSLLFRGPSFDEQRWRPAFRDLLFGEASPFRLPARGWHSEVRRAVARLASRRVDDASAASLDDAEDLDALARALVEHDGVPPAEADREALGASLAEYRRLRFSLHGQPETAAEIEASRRAGHWGSRTHAGFGKVVSAAIPLLHPVFGAALLPFGGVVGPDEGWGWFSRFLARSDRLAAHAVAHDACGYLRRVHGLGPGYAYLAPGDAAHPLRTRHMSGHQYFFWRGSGPWRLLRLEPLVV